MHPSMSSTTDLHRMEMSPSRVSRVGSSTSYCERVKEVVDDTCHDGLVQKRAELAVLTLPPAGHCIETKVGPEPVRTKHNLLCKLWASCLNSPANMPLHSVNSSDFRTTPFVVDRPLWFDEMQRVQFPVGGEGRRTSPESTRLLIVSSSISGDARPPRRTSGLHSSALWRWRHLSFGTQPLAPLSSHRQLSSSFPSGTFQPDRTLSEISPIPCPLITTRTRSFGQEERVEICVQVIDHLAQLDLPDQQQLRKDPSNCAGSMGRP